MLLATALPTTAWGWGLKRPLGLLVRFGCCRLLVASLLIVAGRIGIVVVVSVVVINVLVPGALVVS